ncbi:MAG: HK97 gp10 family phage protein [Candidatus Bathyarchaeota archaeon]|nr:HK97 gp10 family phage protein [Candidatus Bathyarchaeota archaeon]
MSVSISLEISDGEELAQALNRFDVAVQKRIGAQLGQWAESVKANAEQLVPVRTGYLQSTIYAKTQDWQIEVGAEATYAAAVEFGTSNMRAQPYLTPAVEAYLPRLERVLLDALDSAKAEAQL